jgi:hypothetical protein
MPITLGYYDELDLEIPTSLDGSLMTYRHVRRKTFIGRKGYGVGESVQVYPPPRLIDLDETNGKGYVCRKTLGTGNNNEYLVLRNTYTLTPIWLDLTVITKFPNERELKYMSENTIVLLK